MKNCRLLALTLTASLGASPGLLSAPDVAKPVAPSVCDVSSDTGAADSLERRIELCEAAYFECMRDAPGTADSLERWVDFCRP